MTFMGLLVQSLIGRYISKYANSFRSPDKGNNPIEPGQEPSALVTGEFVPHYYCDTGQGSLEERISPSPVCYYSNWFLVHYQLEFSCRYLFRTFCIYPHERIGTARWSSFKCGLWL